MSCSIDHILDPTIQKKIDDGVNSLAADIRKKIDKTDEKCVDSKIDQTVAMVSIICQYIVFAFILAALTQKDTSGIVVKVVVGMSLFTTILLAIQYRNVLISALKILGSLDMTTKVVLILSVLASLGTGYIKKGGAGFNLTLAIAAVLFLRLSLQIKDFMTDKKSPIPAFTKFMREMLTSKRINVLYEAFK